MAHFGEPMDIDSSICDFDNKENSLHHNNVLSRAPCTEKGYEELEVSELSMKLRYSITPASSPRSKSFTANCLDNKQLDTGDNNITNRENASLTRSVNSTLIRSDSIQKVLPLQSLPTDQFIDGNRNALRPPDSSLTFENNVSVTASGPNDLDENLSIPSSTSSLAHTPEVSNPTMELNKQGGGSPIMRGLKSVLSMFRPSQSPILTTDDDINALKPEALSPPVINSPNVSDSTPSTMLVSTPLAAHKTAFSKKETPNRDTIVFSDDLENELEWKDESTVIFSTEKIPIHKLFMTQNVVSKSSMNIVNVVKRIEAEDKLDSTVEYMDISYNDLLIKDETVTRTQDATNKIDITNVTESDSEFVDCETTFSKGENKNDVSLHTKKDVEVSKDHNEVLNTTITKKSLNDTLSNTNDLSPLSPETTKPLVNVENKVTPLVEENNDLLKQEIKDSDQVTNTSETPVSSRQPDPVHYLTVERTDNVTSSCDIKLDVENQNYSNVQIDNVVENIVTSKSNDDHDKLSENIVVSSLSQISLIVDPRVLLFNIPDETSYTVQSTQNAEENKIIPDDQDLEKVEVNKETRKCKQALIDNELKITLDNTEQIPIEDILPEILCNSKETYINDEAKKETDGRKGLQQDLKFEELLTNCPSDYNHEKIDSTNDMQVIQAEITEEIPIEDILHEILCNSKETYIKDEAKKETVGRKGLQQDLKVEELLTNCPSHYNHEKIDFTNDMKVIQADITEEIPNEDIPHEISCNSKETYINDEAKKETYGRQGLQQDIKVKEQTKCSSDYNHEKVDSTNDIQVIQADITTNTVEILPEMVQIKFIEDKQQNVVNNVTSIHKVEVISLQNVLIPDTKNDVTFAVISDENVDYKHESFTLKDNTEIPSSKSVVKYQHNDIQNVTIDVGKSNITVNDDAVENIHDRVETVIAVSNSMDKIEEIDISYSTDVTIPNKAKKLSNAAGNEIETYVKQNLPHSEMTDGIDVCIEVPFSVVETIFEKEIQNEENVTCEENTEVTQDKIQNDDEVAERVSKKSNEILASTSVSNNKIHIQTSEEKSIADQLEETITNIEAKVEVHMEDEIIASKDNSPFVLTTDNLEESPRNHECHTFEKEDNQNSTKTDIDVSLSSSSKIVSPGYNLNFDEIDDPFATKTKISLSPSRDALPNESFENVEINVNTPIIDFNKNTRKSQPAKKKPEKNNKKKSTFSGTSKTLLNHEKAGQTKVMEKGIKTVSTDAMKANDVLTNYDDSESNSKCEDLFRENINRTLATGKDKCNENNIQGPEFRDEEKKTSSSENFTIHSAEVSACEERGHRNVFNLPEIDVANFNPFITKSHVRQSPVTFQETDDFLTIHNQNNSLILSPVPNDNSEKNKTEKAGIKERDGTNQQATVTLRNESLVLEEQNLSNNASNTTCSSKATDEKDITVREVHTEDEDTIEGPFFEAQDLNNEDNISDYFGGGNIDVMQFSEMTNQEAGELFIDAEAFEFLLNQNKTNEVADSGKESLFLKFDPLYAKRMSSDGIMGALNRLQKKQSTPKKISEPPQNDVTFDKSLVAGSSIMNVTLETDRVSEESIEDLNITVTKPMMVVSPAVNPVPAPRNKTITHVRSDRQSLTFTSPAIAVIDRLLSMSANNSLIGHEATVTEVCGHNEADLALTQLRELLADKEISVYNLKSESKELKERLSTLQSQIKNLEAIGEKRLKRINELTEKLAEKTTMNKSMASVVEEYERTIASLIAETEQDRKRHADERLQLINERDEQTRHLASMEVSFSDLHSKYERSKQLIFGFKTNEESLKKSIKDFEENLAKMQTNYELLKQHATSKLNHANEELHAINRAHETNVLKLNAKIKRQELQIASIEENLLQKTKANEELTAICDELINRVG